MLQQSLPSQLVGCGHRFEGTGPLDPAEGLNRWDDRSPRGRLAPMRLKKAILSVMGRDVLKEAVQGLEIDDVDRRSVEKMNARLSRARRATPEYLLEFLSEQDVKYVCERLSISATGRRTTLVSMLLVSAGRSPATERTATAQTEAPEASFGRIAAPQSGGAVRGRDSEERPSNTLYTVGCNGIPEPKEMAELLRKHGVEVLVDVRERPSSFKYLFNKKKLEDTHGPMKSAGLDYLHIVELGNEGRRTGGVRLKNEVKGLARLSEEMRRRVVAIMCQCKDPEKCHRSHVAEKMGERMPGLRIEHLRALSQA